MNAGWVRWGAMVPAAAYATVVAVLAGPVVTLGALAVIVALFASLGSLVTRRLGGWWFAPSAVALAGTAVLALSAGSVAGPPVAPYLLGLVLGAPTLVLAVAGLGRRSAAWAPVSVMGGLAVDAVVLAVVRAIPPADGHSAHAWASTVTSVLSAQETSLRAFATGGAIPAPPLSYTGDAVFDALALIAFLGVLLGWLDPMVRSPTAPTPETRSAEYRPPDTVGPTAGLGPTGARSLVVAVGVVLLFEVAAALSPSDALLGLAVAAPAVVTLVLGVTDRGSRARGASVP
jgi:hypothetical protein